LLQNIHQNLYWRGLQGTSVVDWYAYLIFITIPQIKTDIIILNLNSITPLGTPLVQHWYDTGTWDKGCVLCHWYQLLSRQVQFMSLIIFCVSKFKFFCSKSIIPFPGNAYVQFAAVPKLLNGFLFNPLQGMEKCQSMNTYL